MQTFKVSKNSWHYKLLNIVKAVPYQQDFCSYWRAVLFVVFMLSAVITSILFITYIVIYLLVTAQIAVLKAVSVIIFCLLVAFIPEILSNMNKHSYKPKKQSLIAAKYNSWKHKYCPNIEYEE